ncbi:MAG: oxidoreductase [Thermoanaerobaculia bacterium]
MRSLRPGLLAAAFLAAAAAFAEPPRLSWREQQSGVAVRLRGVSAVSSRVAWASGMKGTVLRTTDGGEHWILRPVPGGEALDFRDVDATSDRVASVLSIGPGEASRIYKTVDGGATWTLQFQAQDPKMFLDAMAFFDERHGVAFGDSVDGQFVILTTENGGMSWTRVPASRLPPALPNEGAFAASGTNISLVGRKHIWIGTSASRVLRSMDGGQRWTVVTTPMATGPTAGIFSIAFRDPKHGVAVGGDYKKESEAVENAAYTADGGTTWTRVVERGLAGFRSVAAWLPRSAGSLVALGPTGIDRSSDGGRTWEPILLDRGYDTVSFAPDGAGWVAGTDGRIVRIQAP